MFQDTSCCKLGRLQLLQTPTDVGLKNKKTYFTAPNNNNICKLQSARQGKEVISNIKNLWNMNLFFHKREVRQRHKIFVQNENVLI